MHWCALGTGWIKQDHDRSRFSKLNIMAPHFIVHEYVEINISIYICNFIVRVREGVLNVIF